LKTTASPFRSAASDTRPLFILAPPRSFTSVVCGMIGQHPGMYGLPELNLFVAQRYRGLETLYRCVRPHLGHGLLRAIAELGLGGQTTENVEAAKKWLQEHASVTTAALFDDLVAWAAPRRVVDKSPLHVLKSDFLTRIRSARPDAQFLHLTRHPLSTCRSVRKLNEEIGVRESAAGAAGRGRSLRLITPETLDPDKVWTQPHARIVEFMADVPETQKLRIRGEDLLASPADALRSIVHWLGVSDAPEAIEEMLHPERSPYSSYGPANALLGADPSYLRSPQLRPFVAPALSVDDEREFTFSPALKALAAELGYG
jgi:hypothetical protein